MSTSCPWSSSSSNRSDSSYPPRTYRPRYSPTRRSLSSSAIQYEVGGIFNLPSLDICKTTAGDFSESLDGIEEGIFNHPVLLLSVEVDYACVLVTSSLVSKKINEYHPNEHHVQMEHIPMLPAEPHHLTKELLRFEKGLKMPKACYLKIKDTHRVPLVCLQSFAVGEQHRCLRLSAESLADLQWARSHTNLERSLRTRRSSSLPQSPPPSPTTLPPAPVRPRRLSATSEPSVLSWRARPTSSPSRQLNENWRRSDPTPRGEASDRRLGHGPDGNWRQQVRG